jgi:hypothetical protein
MRYVQAREWTARRPRPIRLLPPSRLCRALFEPGRVLPGARGKRQIAVRSLAHSPRTSSRRSSLSAPFALFPSLSLFLRRQGAGATTMAAATPAKSDGGAPPRFEIKKWNAVAMVRTKQCEKRGSGEGKSGVLSEASESRKRQAPKNELTPCLSSPSLSLAVELGHLC